MRRQLFILVTIIGIAALMCCSTNDDGEELFLKQLIELEYNFDTFTSEYAYGKFTEKVERLGFTPTKLSQDKKLLGTLCSIDMAIVDKEIAILILFYDYQKYKRNGGRREPTVEIKSKIQNIVENFYGKPYYSNYPTTVYTDHSKIDMILSVPTWNLPDRFVYLLNQGHFEKLFHLVIVMK
jgi:hypothetical protein